jgi:hypothetical protein
MQCTQCGCSELIGRITIVRAYPMAKRGGNIKLGGMRLTNADAVKVWQKTPIGHDKEIFGPILCVECDSEHFYVKGAKTNPHLGSYKEAEKHGPAFFRKGGTLHGPE